MLLLTALLLCCHYLADFSPLSTSRMLAAKSKGSPLGPIALHAAVHALLMGGVLVFYVRLELLIAACLLEWTSHFMIDVGKGKMNVWFPAVADPQTKAHWLLFGLDQLLHQGVILLMVAGVYLLG